LKVYEWLYVNREWIFSGIGISAITFFGVVLKKLFSKKRREKNQRMVIKQKCDGTGNTQIGEQNNYGMRKKDE